MEHAFNRHLSHSKFVDYFKHSPARPATAARSAHHKPTPTKNDKLYTQVSSSSRLTNKPSNSTHHSPGKHKHEKLLKTSVLNYLHKCRSEYEETRTNITIPKTSKNLKIVHAEGKPHKRPPTRHESEILERTEELLGMYRNRCGQLQREKEGYRCSAELAQARVRQLEKSIKLFKQERRSLQREK